LSREFTWILPDKCYTQFKALNIHVEITVVYKQAYPNSTYHMHGLCKMSQLSASCSVYNFYSFIIGWSTSNWNPNYRYWSYNFSRSDSSLLWKTISVSY